MFLSNLLEAIAIAMMATMAIEQFLVGRTHGTGRLPRIHSRVHQFANGSAQRLGPLGQNERYFLNRHYRNMIIRSGPVSGQVTAYANGTKKTVA
jgi:hypothetical protein